MKTFTQLNFLTVAAAECESVGVPVSVLLYSRIAIGREYCAGREGHYLGSSQLK